MPPSYEGPPIQAACMAVPIRRQGTHKQDAIPSLEALGRLRWKDTVQLGEQPGDNPGALRWEDTAQPAVSLGDNPGALRWEDTGQLAVSPEDNPGVLRWEDTGQLAV